MAITLPIKRQIIFIIFSALLLLLALFPARIGASSLTLAWNPNTEDDLAGYKVYYGTRSRDYDYFIDVGDVTEYTITGLAHTTRYYLTVTAYDIWWNESNFSAEVSAVTGDTPFPENGGGGGCFIATTAYSSYLNPRIKILRDFRDEILCSNSLGREFIHLYYQYGPRIANHIEQYDLLQFLSRQALLPLVGMSLLFLKTTAVQEILPMVLFLSFFTLTLRSYFRQTRQPCLLGKLLSKWGTGGKNFPL
ncbi:MAG: CFI-box-CTERM domain-containing protein [Candidatus Hodarchaeota archaeon]